MHDSTNLLLFFPVLVLVCHYLDNKDILFRVKYVFGPYKYINFSF